MLRLNDTGEFYGENLPLVLRHLRHKGVLEDEAADAAQAAYYELPFDRPGVESLVGYWCTSAWNKVRHQRGQSLREKADAMAQAEVADRPDPTADPTGEAALESVEESEIPRQLRAWSDHLLGIPLLDGRTRAIKLRLAQVLCVEWDKWVKSAATYENLADPDPDPVRWSGGASIIAFADALKTNDDDLTVEVVFEIFESGRVLVDGLGDLPVVTPSEAFPLWMGVLLRHGVNKCKPLAASFSWPTDDEVIAGCEKYAGRVRNTVAQARKRAANDVRDQQGSIWITRHPRFHVPRETADDEALIAYLKHLNVRPLGPTPFLWIDAVPVTIAAKPRRRGVVAVASVLGPSGRPEIVGSKFITGSPASWRALGRQLSRRGLTVDLVIGHDRIKAMVEGLPGARFQLDRASFASDLFAPRDRRRRKRPGSEDENGGSSSRAGHNKPMVERLLQAVYGETTVADVHDQEPYDTMIARLGAGQLTDYLERRRDDVLPFTHVPAELWPLVHATDRPAAKVEERLRRKRKRLVFSSVASACQGVARAVADQEG